MSERSGPERVSPDPPTPGEQSPHEAMPSRTTLLNIRQFQLQFFFGQTNKKKRCMFSCLNPTTAPRSVPPRPPSHWLWCGTDRIQPRVPEMPSLQSQHRPLSSLPCLSSRPVLPPPARPLPPACTSSSPRLHPHSLHARAQSRVRLLVPGIL